MWSRRLEPCRDHQLATLSKRAQPRVVLVGVVEDRAVADRIALLRIVAGDAVAYAAALRQLPTSARSTHPSILSSSLITHASVRGRDPSFRSSVSWFESSRRHSRACRSEVGRWPFTPVG